MNVHVFGSDREAYDASQCDDGIRDGDVLLVYGQGAAVLVEAWPVDVLAGDGGHPLGCWHGLDPGVTWETFYGGKYASAARAGRAWLGV